MHTKTVFGRSSIDTKYYYLSTYGIIWHKKAIKLGCTKISVFIIIIKTLAICVSTLVTVSTVQSVRLLETIKSM